MIETIEYNGNIYPAIQSTGNAARFAIPFAQEFCTGEIGYDIGCNRIEWCYPGAIPIDPHITKKWDAMNLPGAGVDYIFNSHLLEHLHDYVAALDYWASIIKQGGVLFMYLPNCDYQHYWRPQNNRKHLHYITPHIIKSYFHDRSEMWSNVFVTDGWDLNGSFYAIANKI